MKGVKGILWYIILGVVVLVSIFIYYLGKPGKPSETKVPESTVVSSTKGQETTLIKHSESVNPTQIQEQSPTVIQSEFKMELVEITGVPNTVEGLKESVNILEIKDYRMGTQIFSLADIETTLGKNKVIIPSNLQLKVGSEIEIRIVNYSKAGLARIEFVNMISVN